MTALDNGLPNTGRKTRFGQLFNFSGVASGLNTAGIASALNLKDITATTNYTANVYKTLLAVPIPGRVNFLFMWQNTAASRTPLRLRVTIDGSVAFNGSGNTPATIGSGFVAIGALNPVAAFTWVFQPIDFQTLLVEAATDLADAGSNLQASINYETRL
jgi:hypothetical protein